MINSMLKVGAGIVLGAGITLSALAWTGGQDLADVKANGESFKEKTIQVIDSLKETQSELDQAEFDLEKAGAVNEGLSATIETLKGQLSALQSKYNKLLGSDTASKAEIESLKKQLDEASSTIQNLEEQLANANADSEALAALQAKYDELKTNFDVLVEVNQMNEKAAFERFQEIERLNGELTKANEEIKKANEAAADHKDAMDEVLDESIFEGILSK